MINKPSDWEEIQPAGLGGRLPADGYVLHIIDAEVKTSESGWQYLDLTIDIAEGDFKNYYARNYENQSGDKNWRGHYRQGTPANKNSGGYFKGLITAIEQSNQGYQWDWNEKSLIGKEVGCLFRDEEWEYNGHSGLRATPFRATTSEKIRSGDFQVPQPKYLNQNNQQRGAQASTASAITFEQVRDQDIPF